MCVDLHRIERSSGILVRSMLTALALWSILQGGFASDAFVAPLGRWSAAGGGPSHSGATRETQVRAPIEVAWSVETQGAIEGEPLVWDGWVYFCVRTAEDRRELRVVDLASGKPLSRPLSVSSPLPLEPSLWSGVIVYRSNPNEIVAVRHRSGALRPVWSLDLPHAGAPLATENGVYVASSAGLVKHALSRRSELWRAQGAFSGETALRGRDVIALETLRGVSFLARRDAKDGVDRGRAALGSLRDSPHDSARELPRLAAYENDCFVRLPSALAVADSSLDLRVAGLRFDDWREDRVAASPWSFMLRQLPVAVGEGWLGRVDDSNGAGVLAELTPNDTGADVVRWASARTHPTLTEARAPATVAGSTVFVGNAAIDLRTKEIVWRAPLSPTERAVPTRDAVLYVDAGHRLVAVRSKAAQADFEVEPTGDLLSPGVLVLRGGAIERGDFRLDREKGTATRGTNGAGASWRLDEVLLFADVDATILCGVEPLRGVEELAREAVMQGLVALANEAKSSGDVALLESLIDEAIDAGADERELAKAEQYADNARKSRNRPTVKAEIVARVDEQRRALPRLAAPVYWRFAQALLGEQRERFFTELARRTLSVDPSHAEAREYVRKLLPLELRPEGDFDALDGLALAAAVEQTPIRVQFPAQASEPSARPDFAQRELAARASSWRGDLLAIQSRSLLIVTPVRRLGALAQCLSYGELVCSTLESLFGFVPAGERDPLVIELYQTREEYVEAVRRSLTSGLRNMEDTLGHYDSLTNVSRFYMDLDPDADQDLLEVTAHELTHHWLRTRAPKWGYRDLKPADLEAPGFWVVEGFACLVEGFGFDVGSGAWTPGGPDSIRLDLVAHAADTSLLPWKGFFARSYEDWDRWKIEGQIQIPMSLKLGALALPSITSLYYAQSEATAHYLFHAEDGALRPVLFEFLENYYSGKSDGLDLPAMLGVSAEDLGRRIQKHAKRVLQ